MRLKVNKLTQTQKIYQFTYTICAVGDDFIPETRELILAAGVNFLDVFIAFVDDVFPEGPEQIEVFLSAAPGALVVSPAYASITILDDDPPLPGMHMYSYAG